MKSKLKEIHCSAEDVAVMENHDKAYEVWNERGVRGRTLVHVDAHIDFGWIPEIDFHELDSHSIGSNSGGKDLLLNPFIRSREKMVHIGNYICPAIRDGMVDKFYWVVPDESWRKRKGILHITGQIRHLLKLNGKNKSEWKRNGDTISCRILDSDLTVCSLENLRRIEEPALLDIDVDFMLTPHIWDDLNPERAPWIFPEELFAALSAKIPEIDVLTIAYSVEGGFTPLKFKYLGDELRALFEGKLNGDSLRCAQLKRRALISEKERRFRDAVRDLEAALKICGMDASICFNLCLLYLNHDIHNLSKARHFYAEAVRADKSYSTEYNNSGPFYLDRNSLKKAEAEYKKFLDVDERNVSAWNGLGYVALARKNYSKAAEMFRNALETNPDHADAKFGTGMAHFRRGRIVEAEVIFRGLRDDKPEEPGAYLWLGRIAEKRGNTSIAITNYKEAVMRGSDYELIHLTLFRLYLKTGLHYRAMEELKRFFAMLKTTRFPG